MSIDLGAIPITGFISPTDNSDTYATHKDMFGKGGYRAVANIAGRNAITIDRRSLGMLVYVIENDQLFQLKDGLADLNWQLLDFSAGNINLPEGYTLIGDVNGMGQASPALIDINLELIDINETLARISTISVVIGEPNLEFPQAQVLSLLPFGFLFHINGQVFSHSIIPLENLTHLTHKYTWVGGTLNRPNEVLFELNSIPTTGDVTLNNFKLTNVIDPNNPQDGATKNYVDNQLVNSVGALTIDGFVTGGPPVANIISTVRTPGDLDMSGDRVINLNQSPQDDLDAVSFKFLWDLMHDEVEVLWL